MERNEFDQVLLQKMEYDMAFKNGYSYVIYNDDPERVIIEESPSVDYNNFQSIGYYDGFNYGEWSFRTGRRYDVKPDNLVAEMDKSFTQALKKHTEYKDNKTKVK